MSMSMSMSMNKTIVTLLMLASVSAFAAGAKDEEKIKVVAAKLDEAWGKADAKAFASAFADDVVLVQSTGDAVKGRAEIEKTFTSLLAGPLKGTTHKLTVSAIHFIKDDIAVIDGEAETSGIKGMPVASMKGKYTAVATRSKGNWTITDVREYVYAPALANPVPAPVPAPK